MHHALHIADPRHQLVGLRESLRNPELPRHTAIKVGNGGSRVNIWPLASASGKDQKSLWEWEQIRSLDKIMLPSLYQSTWSCPWIIGLLGVKSFTFCLFMLPHGGVSLVAKIIVTRLVTCFSMSAPCIAPCEMQWMDRPNLNLSPYLDAISSSRSQN